MVSKIADPELVVENSAAILVFQKNNTLLVKTIIKGQDALFQMPLSRHPSLLLYYWLLNCLKNIFLNLPLDKINLQLDNSSKQIFFEYLPHLKSCLSITGEKIIKYRTIKNNLRNDQKKILAYNINHNQRFKEIVELLKSKEKTLVLYKNYTLDNSPSQYEAKRSNSPNIYHISVDELAKTIIENNINHLITINYYIFYFHFIKENIFLPAFLLSLGVEFNCIDMDQYDLEPTGYLEKKFFNYNAFQRYSTCSPNEFWDNHLAIQNINYITIPFPRKDGLVIYRPSNKTVKIVRAFSHCRLNHVTQYLQLILYILEELSINSTQDLPNLITSFQIWYFSLREIILNDSSIPILEKLQLNSFLYRLSYAISSFIKYIAIDYIDNELIDGDIRFEIYGQEDWNNVFPQYYQHQYLNQKQVTQLLNENNSINLVLNWAPFGICSSGPIFEYIAGNRAFLCLASPVLTPELSALNNIMFYDNISLNKKINNFSNIYQDKKLLRTLEFAKNIFTQNTLDITTSILRQQPIPTVNNKYYQMRQEEKTIKLKLTQKFLKKNKNFISKSVILLYQSKSLQFPIENSRFYHRPFLQKILHHKA